MKTDAAATAKRPEGPSKAPKFDDVKVITDPGQSVAEGAEECDTDAAVRAAKSSRGADEARQAGSKLCLIVDDSRVVRKVSGRVAGGLGYTIIEAENGEEALLRCKQRMPDLVLTDWQMPEMDGLEFVTKLRGIPTSHPPKVVFCTSKGTAKDVHQGIRAGADDYVVKPFDEAALKAKLQKLGVL